MKKLVLALAVAFGASMVACSSSNTDANAEGQATEETTVVEEETIVAKPDTDSVPTTQGESVAPTQDDNVAPAQGDSVK